MPQMPDQIALHDRAGATHRAMGARTSARGGAAPTRREPTSDAPEARDGRAPLRHDQGAHGRDALPHKDTAESRRRDGAQRSRLQSDAGYEHRRYQAADGGDPDMKQLRTLRSSLQLFGPPSARYHTTKTQMRHWPHKFAVMHDQSRSRLPSEREALTAWGERAAASGDGEPM